MPASVAICAAVVVVQRRAAACAFAGTAAQNSGDGETYSVTRVPRPSVAAARQPPNRASQTNAGNANRARSERYTVHVVAAACAAYAMAGGRTARRRAACGAACEAATKVRERHKQRRAARDNGCRADRRYGTRSGGRVQAKGEVGMNRRKRGGNGGQPAAVLPYQRHRTQRARVRQ